MEISSRSRLGVEPAEARLSSATTRLTIRNGRDSNRGDSGKRQFAGVKSPSLDLCVAVCAYPACRWSASRRPSSGLAVRVGRYFQYRRTCSGVVWARFLKGISRVNLSRIWSRCPPTLTVCY